MMRPVILALTGAEAMTLRAHVDVQIDREIELLEATEGQLDPQSAKGVRAQIDLLRSLRDKLDASIMVRESVIEVPF